jgi:uncharacterized protein
MYNAVGIMARFPVPGEAKTRLAAGLGPEGAAAFYDECARLVFKEIGSLPAGIKKYIFITGTGRVRDIAIWAGPGFICRRQAGDGLGGRLQHAFGQLFTGKAERAVTIASDIPDFSANLVAEAFTALESCDLVLGPCLDGGYYLIGMRKLHPALFHGITWGSAEVLAQTCAAAERSGLALRLLPSLIDIDTYDDYKFWRSILDKPVRRGGSLSR